jgi:hypothetical protein
MQPRRTVLSPVLQLLNQTETEIQKHRHAEFVTWGIWKLTYWRHLSWRDHSRKNVLPHKELLKRRYGNRWSAREAHDRESTAIWLLTGGREIEIEPHSFSLQHA